MEKEQLSGLPEFLVRAKAATYAGNGERDESVLEDGCKELRYHGDRFKYRDRYYGSNPFVGEEIVWNNSGIVWAMNYYGRLTTTDLPADEVYDFLKKAMRQVSEERPFRGPDRYIQGDYEYKDSSTGDVVEFHGMETILYKGREIYNLTYHGGMM